jgi:hypothetical protein
MGETNCCNSSAVAAPGAAPGAVFSLAVGAAAVGAAAGVATADCSGAATGDGSVVAVGEGVACGSSLREHPASIGEVDIRIAVTRIDGKDFPCGLVSNPIVDKPRASSEADIFGFEATSR